MLWQDHWVDYNLDMNHEMLQQDTNEQVLTVVKRSLFGVLPHVVIGLALLVALLGLVFAVARYPDNIESIGGTGSVLLFGIVAFLVAELVIYMLIRVYLGNKLIVTTESLVQRLQNTLFHHKTSQLRLEDIEDVTFSQSGFFAQTFNFGTINIETAGEQVNFIFTFAKNPREAIRIIIEAQENVAHGPNNPGSP